MKNYTIIGRGNGFGFMAARLGLAMTLLILLAALPGFSKPDSYGMSESYADTFCTHNSDHDGYKAFTQGNATREYVLYVPDSYDNNTPTPLLINFHGFGDCASDYSETIGDFYDLNSLADKENFLVAYPQAIIREKEDPAWYPGDNGGQDIIANDVFFAEQLIADVKAEYNVELNRVYATGYSNGGMMVYGLACYGADFIAAGGIMSGTMLDDTPEENKFTPIVHFHGIADDVLPYEGNQWYQPISDVVDFWLNHNNIPTSSLVTTQLNGGDVVRDEYTGGNENTSVVLYTLHEEHGKPGGHVWFSDDIDGTNPNQILWDFLSKYDNGTTAINNGKLGGAHGNVFSLKLTAKSIILETNFLENHKYEIFTVDGKKVLEGIINSKEQQINVSNLSPNIHFLKIKNKIMKIIFMELPGR